MRASLTRRVAVGTLDDFGPHNRAGNGLQRIEQRPATY